MSFVAQRPAIGLDCMKLDVLNTIENVFLRQALMEVLSQSVNCTTMREQMAFIHRPIMGSVPPFELIGSVFSLSRGTVYNHIHRFAKEQKMGVRVRKEGLRVSPLKLWLICNGRYQMTMPLTFRAHITIWRDGCTKPIVSRLRLTFSVISSKGNSRSMLSRQCQLRINACSVILRTLTAI